jgi:hypothetical protein
MIALLCFVLAILAAPYKSKGRLEAENAALTGKPLICVNASRPHLRQENNIRHEGKYRLNW